MSATMQYLDAANDGFAADGAHAMSDGCDGVLNYLLDRSRDWMQRLTPPRSETPLTSLLTTLAIAASEANDTATAFNSCLRHICEYGGWTLGHVATFAPSANPGIPVHSFWQIADGERFAEFIALREGTDYRKMRGTFIGKVVSDQQPQWLQDLERYRDGGNGIGLLRSLGMRSGFAFPVVVNGETLALLEFFAAETRSPDAALFDVIAAVSAQLARLLERELAHNKLLDSRRRMADILGTLSESVWSCKPHTYECIYANPATGTLFGCSRKQFIDDPELWRKSIHPDDRDPVLARLPMLYREGTLELRHRIVRLDGDIRYVHTRLKLIRDASGNPVRIDGMITDTTAAD